MAGLERTRSQRGAAGPWLVAAVVVVLAALAVAGWFATRPAAGPPPTTPPSTAPAPPVSTTLPPTTAPATTVPPTTAAPMPPPPTTPAATADPETEAAFARSFVAGKTLAEGGAMPPGFLPPDETSPDMKVARASGVPVRLEFEVQPPHVRPGDAYVVRILLRNVGGKPLTPAGLSLKTTTDGQSTEKPHAVKAGAVGPGQSATLAEVSGTWSKGVSRWSLDARVMTDRGEVYRAELTWQ